MKIISWLGGPYEMGNCVKGPSIRKVEEHWEGGIKQ